MIHLLSIIKFEISGVNLERKKKIIESLLKSITKFSGKNIRISFLLFPLILISKFTFLVIIIKVLLINILKTVIKEFKI